MYQEEAPRKAQGAVLVIAVIHILLGALGVLGGIFGMATPLLVPLLKKMAASSGAALPPMDVLAHPALIGLGALAFTVGLLYVVSGVMLIMLKEAGRKLARAAAGIKILEWITSTAVNLAIIQPEMQKAMAKVGAAPTPPMAQMLGTVIGLAVGAVFGLVYPIAVIVLLGKPAARAQFDEPDLPVLG